MAPAILEKARDWPAYWFVRLETALTEGQAAMAVEAIGQLARLGFAVVYTGPRPTSACRPSAADRGVAVKPRRALGR